METLKTSIMQVCLKFGNRKRTLVRYLKLCDKGLMLLYMQILSSRDNYKFENGAWKFSI